MGYAATTIIMYGVPIDEHIAQKINTHEMNHDIFNDKEMYKNCFYRKDYPNSGHKQPTPVTPYSFHDFGGGDVFNPQMLSDGTDSRIHSNTFEQEHQHYLGIYIASKGYGYEDQINKFLKEIPKEAIENFNNSIQPLLDKYQVKETPDIQIIEQTW